MTQEYNTPPDIELDEDLLEGAIAFGKNEKAIVDIIRKDLSKVCKISYRDLPYHLDQLNKTNVENPQAMERVIDCLITQKLPVQSVDGIQDPTVKEHIQFLTVLKKHIQK